ncbi:MAG: hypothetical protein NVS3B24_09750 [Candidatus Dormibacteria bacterium]
MGSWSIAGKAAWGHRHLALRAGIAAVATVLGLPLLLALAVTAALARPRPPVAGFAAAARPITGWVVTQPYGCTGLGIEPARGDCPHFHFGIDLAAPAGTSVAAVAAGQAEVFAPSGYGGGYGLHVVVRHGNGVETLYAHLAATVIGQGQLVSAGTLLGYEGSSGMSTGPHLHFEVREAGVAVDPTRIFPGVFGPEGEPR